MLWLPSTTNASGCSRLLPKPGERDSKGNYTCTYIEIYIVCGGIHAREENRRKIRPDLKLDFVQVMWSLHRSIAATMFFFCSHQSKVVSCLFSFLWTCLNQIILRGGNLPKETGVCVCPMCLWCPRSIWSHLNHWSLHVCALPQSNRVFCRSSLLPMGWFIFVCAVVCLYIYYIYTHIYINIYIYHVTENTINSEIKLFSL